MIQPTQLLAWALGLLEFEVPLAFDPATPMPPRVPAVPSHRFVFRFCEHDEAGEGLYSVPFEWRLQADDENEAIRAELQPLAELHPRAYASGVDLADRLNAHGFGGAARYEPERSRLVIRSCLSQQRHFTMISDEELLPGHRESTLNWLLEQLRLADRAADGVARLLARPSRMAD